MRRSRPGSPIALRLVAAALAAALACPSSVLALRPTGLEESEQTKGEVTKALGKASAARRTRRPWAETHHVLQTKLLDHPGGRYPTIEALAQGLGVSDRMFDHHGGLELVDWANAQRAAMTPPRPPILIGKADVPLTPAQQGFLAVRSREGSGKRGRLPAEYQLTDKGRAWLADLREVLPPAAGLEERDLGIAADFLPIADVLARAEAAFPRSKLIAGMAAQILEELAQWRPEELQFAEQWWLPIRLATREIMELAEPGGRWQGASRLPEVRQELQWLAEQLPIARETLTEAPREPRTRIPLIGPYVARWPAPREKVSAATTLRFLDGGPAVPVTARDQALIAGAVARIETAAPAMVTEVQRAVQVLRLAQLARTAAVTSLSPAPGWLIIQWPFPARATEIETLDGLAAAILRGADASRWTMDRDGAGLFRPHPQWGTLHHGFLERRVKAARGRLAAAKFLLTAAASLPDDAKRRRVHELNALVRDLGTIFAELQHQNVLASYGVGVVHRLQVELNALSGRVSALSAASGLEESPGAAGLEEAAEVDQLVEAYGFSRDHAANAVEAGWTLNALRRLEALHGQFNEFVRTNYGVAHRPTLLLRPRILGHPVSAFSNRDGSWILVDAPALDYQLAERGLNRWYLEEWVRTFQQRFLLGERFMAFPELTPIETKEFFAALKQGFSAFDERWRIPPFDIEPFLVMPLAAKEMSSFDSDVAQEALEVHAAAIGWWLSLSWVPKPSPDRAEQRWAFWDATMALEETVYAAVSRRQKWGHATGFRIPYLAARAAMLDAVREIDRTTPFLPSTLRWRMKWLAARYAFRVFQFSPDRRGRFLPLRRAYKQYFLTVFEPFRGLLATTAGLEEWKRPEPTEGEPKDALARRLTGPFAATPGGELPTREAVAAEMAERLTAEPARYGVFAAALDRFGPVVDPQALAMLCGRLLLAWTDPAMTVREDVAQRLTTLIMALPSEESEEVLRRRVIQLGHRWEQAVQKAFQTGLAISAIDDELVGIRHLEQPAWLPVAYEPIQRWMARFDDGHPNVTTSMVETMALDQLRNTEDAQRRLIPDLLIASAQVQVRAQQIPDGALWRGDRAAAIQRAGKLVEAMLALLHDAIEPPAVADTSSASVPAPSGLEELPVEMGMEPALRERWAVEMLGVEA